MRLPRLEKAASHHTYGWLARLIFNHLLFEFCVAECYSSNLAVSMDQTINERRAGVKTRPSYWFPRSSTSIVRLRRATHNTRTHMGRHPRSRHCHQQQVLATQQDRVTPPCRKFLKRKRKHKRHIHRSQPHSNTCFSRISLYRIWKERRPVVVWSLGTIPTDRGVNSSPFSLCLWSKHCVVRRTNQRYQATIVQKRKRSLIT
jgi:hypothetical protein